MTEADVLARIAASQSVENLDLTALDFGTVNLTGVNFTGCICVETEFTGATLTNVNFTNCDLTAADFSNAIQGGMTLTGANTRWARGLL